MIDTLEDFLLRAARLEADAAEGYMQLASTMDSLDKTEIADLFRKFAGFSRMHLSEMQQTQIKELGHVLDHSEAVIVWPDELSPENPLAAMKSTDINPRQAIEIALEAERTACDFYSAVAGQTRSAEVQELAQEFAEEESEHVEHLQKWLERI